MTFGLLLLFCRWGACTSRAPWGSRFACSKPKPLSSISILPTLFMLKYVVLWFLSSLARVLVLVNATKESSSVFACIRDLMEQCACLDRVRTCYKYILCYALYPKLFFKDAILVSLPVVPYIFGHCVSICSWYIATQFRMSVLVMSVLVTITQHNWSSVNNGFLAFWLVSHVPTDKYEGNSALLWIWVHIQNTLNV